MKTRVHPKDFDAVRSFINELQSLEDRAHRLKMIDTAHVLNKAKNTAGWELEGQMQIHMKAAEL